MRVTASTLATFMAVGLASAQTSTDCNPTEKSCPADVGLDATTFSSNFLEGSSSNTSWSGAIGTDITYGPKGAEFTISGAGQAPTIQTDFYFFFGSIEVVMQAAPGTGIVSSIVLESDDLDEVDWEFLGGDGTQAETNYFGKGNTTTYDRAIYYPVSSPQTSFHTYTVDWSSSAIVFSIDGAAVRTLNYEDANGGTNFPQTPMRLKLGNWAGGAAGEPAGTVEWAGGATDFSKGPFTMYVQSVKITNTNPAKEYQYGDETGSWQSIKIVNDDGSSEGSSGGSTSTGSSAATSTTASSKAAPTSSVSVAAVMQTEAAVSSTLTGSVSSGTAKASSSAQAAGYSSANASGNATASTLQTLTGAYGATATAGGYGGSATAGGYGSTATSGASSTGTSGSSSGNSTHSSNSSATVTSSPVQQTAASGASANSAAMALFTILSFGVCLLML